MRVLQIEAPRGGPLVVHEVGDRASFLALEAEWNALVARTDDQVFYRHDFIRTWLAHFAPGGRLRVLTARNEAGSLVSVLPLVARRTKLLGVPLRLLASASNVHSCRFDLIAEDAQAASTAFLDHLRGPGRGGWDLLELSDVPRNGRAWTLFEAARSRGLPVASGETICSPWVPLPGDYEALARELDSKFKANLRRRRKRLEEKGRVELEFFSGGPELEARLSEGFALEESGWKGQEGTAIARSKETLGFYTELAKVSMSEGRLLLAFLRLDGRPVAFHYALVHGDRYLLLKPGFDEGLKECSPGQLMMEEAFRECIRRGMTELDFLGPDMTWKQDWTGKVRPHDRLLVFRDSALGRALCAARFRWGPRAKRWLAGWKGRGSR